MERGAEFAQEDQAVEWFGKYKTSIQIIMNSVRISSINERRFKPSY